MHSSSHMVPRILLYASSCHIKVMQCGGEANQSCFSRASANVSLSSDNYGSKGSCVAVCVCVCVYVATGPSIIQRHGAPPFQRVRVCGLVSGCKGSIECPWRPCSVYHAELSTQKFRKNATFRFTSGLGPPVRENRKTESSRKIESKKR